ncbi:DUF5677 domain-containing protein [Thalassospira lucentensis]|uniref:DUF5677 domain-containing protein n=1 Tax=Thalassospira lucentensis TaxID=168935 RepID=UPI003D2CCC34
MSFEGFSTADFREQKENRWRLQGKTFYDIFSEIEHADLYASSYGMMSESIHGSWNDSMDWCLIKNDDRTFSTYPFSHPADIRYVTPILRFTNRPFRQWLQRIDAFSNELEQLLNWIENINTLLFRKFDERYEG